LDAIDFVVTRRLGRLQVDPAQDFMRERERPQNWTKLTSSRVSTAAHSGNVNRIQCASSVRSYVTRQPVRQTARQEIRRK
jgi:hypothetical protein